MGRVIFAMKDVPSKGVFQETSGQKKRLKSGDGLKNLQIFR